MKKFLNKYANTNNVGDRAKQEEAEEEMDFSQLAQSLLLDHRELAIRAASPLPEEVANPETFPYYIPTASSSSDTSDTMFVKQTGVETQNAIAYIRDDWIRSEMKSQENTFTTPHGVNIFVCTLNCSGRKPELREVELLLQNAMRYDVIVVGLQEMVDLNVTNAMSDAASRERTQLWLDMIQRSTPAAEYVLLASKYLVGIMLCVFVAKPLKPHVAGTQTFCVSTGVMGGLVGNKGGCSIRFELFDTSFCFTSAHLAAHVEGMEARNSDVRAISEKCKFKLPTKTAHGLVPEKHHSRIASTTPAALHKGELELAEHDYTIWLGDFNYRVDRATPEEVLDNVRDLAWLEQRDQLRREMLGKRVFDMYKEVARVTFPPTYKYEPGTDQYERRVDKKLRAPAWTDRVVWKHAEYQASCVFYNANPQVKFSDHRPVECGLKTTVRVVNDDARNFAYRTVQKKLEVVAAAAAAATGGGFSVSSDLVDFGRGVYRQVLSHSITLRNDQTMPVVWRIVQRPDSPCWFATNQAFGLLLPGESTVLEFEMEIGMETIRMGQQQANALVFRDVVEIRVHPANGIMPAAVHGASAIVATLHTCFVGVRGELVPSCFGASSLAALLWCSKPVQQFGSGEAQFAMSSSAAAAGDAQVAPLTVPKELWRLAYRLQRDVGAYRLFLMHADQDECTVVRHCLDTGSAFPSNLSPYAFSSTLLELLDSLVEPVVPVDMFPEESSVQNDPYWATNWLAALPTPNYNTLHLVLALVNWTLHAGHKNKVTLPALAPLFAEVLFRPSLAAYVSRETATTTASGFGEFASWLGGGSTAANKVETTKLQAAVSAFMAIVITTQT